MKKLTLIIALLLTTSTMASAFRISALPIIGFGLGMIYRGTGKGGSTVQAYRKGRPVDGDIEIWDIGNDGTFREKTTSFSEGTVVVIKRRKPNDAFICIGITAIGIGLMHGLAAE